MALHALAIFALGFALSVGAAVIALARISPVAAGAADPAGGGVADWTVLVYMASDNNLEPAALNNLRQIAAVGSSPRLRIVAQVDRIASPESWDDSTAGNWTDTKRFLITQGMEPDATMAVQCLGELNTGDPATLSDFIVWGMANYPARHYALILWSHGGAWQGLASDDSSGGDSLTLPELGTALAAARARTGYGQIDLIGFDACLMAQLDVFQVIAPYARVVVASAEIEPSQGWAWEAWLGALAANPGQDAASVAGVIVDSYISAYQGTDDVTLAAFDLAEVDHISLGLARLASALRAGGPAGDARIAYARATVDIYAPSLPDAFSAVDLGRLTQLLAAHGATHDVAAAAEVTANAIRHACIAYGSGQSHRDGSGISIYFPLTAAQYAHDYEHDSPLTRWADFLKAYHHSALPQVARANSSGW